MAERTTQLEQLNAQLQADILERQRAQEALSASEHQYRTTIDSMEEAIHLVDPECRIMLANRTLQQWILEDLLVPGGSP